DNGGNLPRYVVTLGAAVDAVLGAGTNTLNFVFCASYNEAQKLWRGGRTDSIAPAVPLSRVSTISTRATGECGTAVGHDDCSWSAARCVTFSRSLKAFCCCGVGRTTCSMRCTGRLIRLPPCWLQSAA